MCFFRALVFIAGIGVFGVSLGVMQLFLTQLLLLINMLLTAIIRPFKTGGNYAGLQSFEQFLLMILWLNVWAGSGEYWRRIDRDSRRKDLAVSRVLYYLHADVV